MGDLKRYLDGGDRLKQGAFTALLCSTDGLMELSEESGFSILFVLSGGIRLNSCFHSQYVAGEQVIIICRSKVQTLHCETGTILLEFTPSLRLSSLFEQCCKTLISNYTKPVSINPDLQTWIDCRMAELAADVVPYAVCPEAAGQDLAAIMLEYSRVELQEMYIPFYALMRNFRK